MDWRASVRAGWHLVRYRRVVSGGSTITQQLIKLAEPRPRTFRTKLVEAIQALGLELQWDKNRILTEYFNRLDYGNFNTGCAAAADFYFGKPLRDLSVAECALLAGLPQAPSRLNPLRNLDPARKRQQWILGRMRDIGWLDEEAWKRAGAEPLRLAAAQRSFQAPHFVDLLLAHTAFPKETRRIQTTIDLKLNQVAEKAVQDQLARLDGQNVRNAAVVVIENASGAVRALVGSENYRSPNAGQVNGAWAPRSAGSTFKPFTYLLALERGATPATVFADIPDRVHHGHGSVRARELRSNLARAGATSPRPGQFSQCACGPGPGWDWRPGYVAGAA